MAAYLPVTTKVILIALAIVVPLLIVAPTAIILNWRFYFQNTITASSVTNYHDEVAPSIDTPPFQVDVEGSENGTYKGRPIMIKYKAYYDISGIVTSVHDYWLLNDYDSLVPRDVCIAWGSLANAYLGGKATFRQSDRSCVGEYDKQDLAPSEIYAYRTHYGKIEDRVNSYSNNHLIPSTAEIRDQIFNLQAGARVRISGYLVYVQYGGLYLESSLKRNDSANGACEVFYVTKIENLAENSDAQ